MLESDKTVPNLDFFRKLYGRRYSIRQSKDCHEVDDLLSSKITSGLLDGCQLRLIWRFWILLVTDHCKSRLWDRVWLHRLFSLNSKAIANWLMTKYCHTWWVGTCKRNLKPWWIWRLFLAVYERANGRLDDMEVSDEINACSVSEVDVNGWKNHGLLMFR